MEYVTKKAYFDLKTGYIYPYDTKKDKRNFIEIASFGESGNVKDFNFKDKHFLMDLNHYEENDPTERYVFLTKQKAYNAIIEGLAYCEGSEGERYGNALYRFEEMYPRF